MKNSLADLNNALFETLERLNDEEMSAEQLENEIKRSKAVCDVSTQIINNGKLVIEAAKLDYDAGNIYKIPEFITKEK